MPQGKEGGVIKVWRRNDRRCERRTYLRGNPGFQTDGVEGKRNAAWKGHHSRNQAKKKRKRSPNKLAQPPPPKVAGNSEQLIGGENKIMFPKLNGKRGKTLA